MGASGEADAAELAPIVVAPGEEEADTTAPDIAPAPEEDGEQADAAEPAPIVVAPGEDEKEKGEEKKVGNRGQSNGNKAGKGRGKKGENTEGKIGQTTNGKE